MQEEPIHFTERDAIIWSRQNRPADKVLTEPLTRTVVRVTKEGQVLVLVHDNTDEYFWSEAKEVW